MQAMPAIQQNTATKVKQMQNKNEYTEVKIMTYWEFFKKLIGDKFKTSYHAARWYAPADRGGSMSVRERICSLHSSGGLAGLGAAHVAHSWPRP